MTVSPAPDLLATIVAATRARIAAARARVPAHDLDRQAEARGRREGCFAAALDRGTGINVIAECKRRSPSRGVLRRMYDPVSIATAYENAGAAAISVLTEPTFFDGCLDHLRAVRAAVCLPVLRKDFIVDDYQLLEAAAAGADAVLLIVAALTSRDLAALHARAHRLGLEALVEVHDVAEVDRAVDAGARIIGVNNRNLRTLAVDTDASTACAARLPAGVLAVSESGLKTEEDLRQMAALGYRAVLMGERFMTAPDPGAALRAVLDATSRDARPPRAAS
jgi:indole-3-glycerol phosphate synthase